MLLVVRKLSARVSNVVATVVLAAVVTLTQREEVRIRVIVGEKGILREIIMTIKYDLDVALGVRSPCANCKRKDLCHKYCPNCTEEDFAVCKRTAENGHCPVRDHVCCDLIKLRELGVY